MFQTLRRWLGLSPKPVSGPADVAGPAQATSHSGASGSVSADRPVRPDPAKPVSPVPPVPGPTVADATRTPAAPTPVQRTPIASWAYQLQDIDCAEIAELDVDLVVVDYAEDGTAETAFSVADVARMKARPKGGEKRVVAYISIGEAETYRYYWRPEWSKPAHRPSWLDRENPYWDENYKVRYWEPGWQQLVYGAPEAYLDRIIAAGFDGVYLDIIDAYEHYEGQREQARADMIAFVTALAGYARRQRPGFAIIPQNGEALLESDSYRSVIDAIGKEDLFFGVDADEVENLAEETKTSLDLLDLARRDGIPVLVVEYLDSAEKIGQVRRHLAPLGYASTFAPRDLDAVRIA